SVRGGTRAGAGRRRSDRGAPGAAASPPSLQARRVLDAAYPPRCGHSRRALSPQRGAADGTDAAFAAAGSALLLAAAPVPAAVPDGLAGLVAVAVDRPGQGRRRFSRSQ